MTTHLKYNLQKQGVGCANVMLEDARKLSDFFSFDKILLDAPCSGSGTMSVFDDGFGNELINRSSRTQEELLRMYKPLLMKESVIDGVYDEDLYQELCYRFICCIDKFDI